METKFFTLKFINDKRFYGSTIALELGILAMVSALAKYTAPIGYAIPWLYMILGAVAYRSAKKRKLKLVENTKKRKLLEFLALAFMALLFLTDQQVLQIIQDGDILNLVIVVWGIIAYLFVITLGWKKAAESAVS